MEWDHQAEEGYSNPVLHKFDFVRSAVFFRRRFNLRAFFLRLIPGCGVALCTTLAVFGQIQGVPWQGANGITEPVSTIMAREQNAPPQRAQSIVPRPARSAPQAREDNPDSPALSHWPPLPSTGGEAKADEERNRITLGGNSGDQPLMSALTQTLGTTSFLGTTLADAGFVPPNAQGAVGPSQILFAMNGRIRTFTKTGVQDGAINVSTNTFFASVDGGNGTSDTRVLYDRLTQRFFVTMITTGVSPNSILIAVSSGSTITSTSSFTFFSFVQDQPVGGPSNDTGNFADYPSSGVDKFALYIGVNIFNPALIDYLDSSVFVINKANLLSGTLTVTAFRAVASNSIPGPFAPQGVSNMDPNATAGYFAGNDPTVVNVVRFLKVSDPGGTPSYTLLKGLTVQTIRAPSAVPAKGSNEPLDGIDLRLGATQIVVMPDLTEKLWTVETAKVNSSGVSGTLPPSDRDGVRFYEVDMANATATTAPTLVQAATLYDKTTTTNYFWVPSVATNGQGHTILASSYAGASNYAGIAIDGRLYTDSQNTLNSNPVFISSGEAYNVQGGPISTLGTITSGGSGYTNGTYNGVALTGGSGTGATANITVSTSNTVTTVAIVSPGTGYLVNETLSAAGSSIGGTGSGFSVAVASLEQTPISTLGTITGGSSYTNGTYSGVALTGGSGTGAKANITVSGNAVTAVAIVNGGIGYKAGSDILSAAASSIGGTGSGFSVPVASLAAISQRWGDLSSTVVDPNDNMTIWTFQEFTNATNSWGVQAVQIMAPPPPPLSAFTVTPSTVSAGTTVNVVISTSGTAANFSGSGFYDPGPGFQNRLSASVSGSGITVNSVTYTNPTSITLNITVSATAAQTGYTITVTNPDGQAVVSPTNFLTVGPPATITVSPSLLPTATVGVAYNQTVTASGGTAPYAFTIITGALPAGLSLSVYSSTAAMITGTPTISGAASFTVQAQDSLSSIGLRAYNLSVQTLLTQTISLPIVSTAYDATPVPGYNAGKFTLNTKLINNGPTISGTSDLYFVITELVKYYGDPSQPDALLTADNRAGTVGATQTVNLGGVALGAGNSIPVSFTLGIGTQNTFTLNLDLYMVAPGAAIRTSDTARNLSTTVTPWEGPTRVGGFHGASADTRQPGGVLLGHFVLTGSETANPSSSSDSPPPVSFSNLGVITGPGAHSRPAVAVDPVLPNRIAIASNDYLGRTVRITTSQDGGKTWQSAALSTTAGGQTFFVAQNPSLAFDSFGRLSVVYSVANLSNSSNAIVVSESTDLINFNPPSVITLHPASDQTVDSRPVVAINAHVGRIVAWDRLFQSTSQYSIMAAQSAEGGLFDPPVTVVDGALVNSPTLALSHGTVYLGWDDWGFHSSKSYDTGGRLMVAVSANETSLQSMFAASSKHKRLRFGPPTEIAETTIGFGQRIPAMPDAGARPDLALAADPQNESNVYAVFADRVNGIDIRFGHSEDRGKRWKFTQVNNDTGAADHFNPSITVDAGGHVKVGYYDTEFSSTFQTAHVILARSAANGNAFDNQSVTTALINDSITNPLRDTTENLGDRTAIAMMNDDVLIAWTDTRNGSENIFASSVFDPVGESITGSGSVKLPAGSFALDTSAGGIAEFGFSAGYRKGALAPDGPANFRFQIGNARFDFTSTSYESLVVSGAMAELQGSGTINAAGDYLFLLTIADGKISGTGNGQFRIRLTDKITGAVVYDSMSAAPEAVLQPITAGRIQIRHP